MVPQVEHFPKNTKKNKKEKIKEKKKKKDMLDVIRTYNNSNYKLA